MSPFGFWNCFVHLVPFVVTFLAQPLDIERLVVVIVMRLDLATAIFESSDVAALFAMGLLDDDTLDYRLLQYIVGRLIRYRSAPVEMIVFSIFFVVSEYDVAAI